MILQHKELQQGYVNHFVWQRDTGNLVIIIIDDEIGEVNKKPDDINFLHQRALPQLREYACRSSDIRAMGFFRLMTDTDDALQTLVIIDKWIKSVSNLDHQVRFLVDILYGENPSLAAPGIVKALKEDPYSYQHDQIAYLTQAGVGPLGKLPETYGVFGKHSESEYFQKHNVFTHRLMSFLGIGLHEDKIIDDAIQFYAKAWTIHWHPEGWSHDALENKCSDHSKALADWLGIDVNDLCDWEEGESSKSLVIWVGEMLWTVPRQMQGKVLNAVLKKLLPSTTICSIPDEPIDIPCTPCLPFFVSLRSFLLRCQEKGAPVSEIKFIQENDECTLRLMIKLNNSQKFEKRFRETHCQYESLRQDEKPLPKEHTFTKSLIYLIYGMTEGLLDGMGRDYMPLFTDGTEEPIVEVGITSEYIDLIWKC